MNYDGSAHTGHMRLSSLIILNGSAQMREPIFTIPKRRESHASGMQSTDPDILLMPNKCKGGMR